MKLLLILVVLALSNLTKADNIGSSDGNGKYVLQNVYQEADITCSNEVVATKYFLSGGCNLGTMATCNGNVIEISQFSNTNCTGDAFETTNFQTGQCAGANLKFYCTDTIEFPENSYSAIYTSDYSCDWKDSEITQIVTTNTNICVESENYGGSISTCNSTALTFSRYPIASSCSSTPYYVSSFDFQTCTPGEYFSSITYICN